MEYSCKVAGSKLVFVLGHEDCGAVKVACDCVKVGNITSMLENIKPAVDLSKKQIAGVKNSSNKEFVEKTINRIRKKSPILKEMEKNDEIKIVGGIYHFATGKVVLL